MLSLLLTPELQKLLLLAGSLSPGAGGQAAKARWQAGSAHVQSCVLSSLQGESALGAGTVVSEVSHHNAPICPSRRKGSGRPAAIAEHNIVGVWCADVRAEVPAHGCRVQHTRRSLPRDSWR